MGITPQREIIKNKQEGFFGFVPVNSYGHAGMVSSPYHTFFSGVVTVQDSQSGKSFSSILNLAKNVQKSPIKCLKEQNNHRKQSVYAYLIVNI